MGEFAYEIWDDWDFENLEDEEFECLDPLNGAVVYRPRAECKFCHGRPFFWHETERGWRLFDEKGKLHYCLKYKPTKT